MWWLTTVLDRVRCEESRLGARRHRGSRCVEEAQCAALWASGDGGGGDGGGVCGDGDGGGGDGRAREDGCGAVADHSSSTE